MGQIVQIAGALAVLACFLLAQADVLDQRAYAYLVPNVLLQAGRLSQHGRLYLALNLAGSAMLAAVAWLDGQWGFVILQGAWALAALAGISARARARR